MAKTEDMLRRLLVRIEENWGETRRGLRGKIAGLGRGSFIIGFQTENERITITLTKDGRAILGDDRASRHNFDLEGPEKDILALLADGSQLKSVPSPIQVKIGGREFTNSAQFGMEVMAREAAAKKLRDLLR